MSAYNFVRSKTKLTNFFLFNAAKNRSRKGRLNFVATFILSGDICAQAQK